MNIRKIATLCTVLALALGMTSCAPKPEAQAESGSAMKIAICTSPNGG